MQSAVPHQQAGLWQPQAEFLRLLIYCGSSQSELLRRQSLLWRMQAGLRHPQSVSDKLLPVLLHPEAGQEPL